MVRQAPEEPKFILDNGDLDLTEETVTAIEEQAVKGRFIGVVVAPEHKADIAAALKASEHQLLRCRHGVARKQCQPHLRDRSQGARVRLGGGGGAGRHS